MRVYLIYQDYPTFWANHKFVTANLQVAKDFCAANPMCEYEEFDVQDLPPIHAE